VQVPSHEKLLVYPPEDGVKGWNFGGRVLTDDGLNLDEDDVAARTRIRELACERITVMYRVLKYREERQRIARAHNTLTENTDDAKLKLGQYQEGIEKFTRTLRTSAVVVAAVAVVLPLGGKKIGTTCPRGNTSASHRGPCSHVVVLALAHVVVVVLAWVAWWWCCVRGQATGPSPLSLPGRSSSWRVRKSGACSATSQSSSQSAAS